MGETIAVNCGGCELESTHLIGSGEAGIEHILCACASCARFVDIERSVFGDDPMLALVCPHCDEAVSIVTIDFGARPQAGRIAQLLRNNGYEPRQPRPAVPATCPSCGHDVKVTPTGLWD